MHQQEVLLMTRQAALEGLDIQRKKVMKENGCQKVALAKSNEVKHDVDHANTLALDWTRCSGGGRTAPAGRRAKDHDDEFQSIDEGCPA